MTLHRGPTRNNLAIIYLKKISSAFIFKMVQIGQITDILIEEKNVRTPKFCQKCPGAKYLHRGPILESINFMLHYFSSISIGYSNFSSNQNT